MKPLTSVIAEAALIWRDHENYPHQQDAIRATLSAPNQFTPEALDFAIEQQMSEITESSLNQWIRGRSPEESRVVGVVNPGNVPFVGLQDLLAVLLCGHSYRGTLSRKSPHLLPAFIQTIHQLGGNVSVRFLDQETLWDQIHALIATGSDVAISQIRSHATARGILPDRCLFRRTRYGIAIIDGLETEDELNHLAMDILLHEGMGCRSVALLFSPEGLEPDRFLEHLAQIRSIFPAHDSTSGRLAMQQAYLAAINSPHAYGDGLEFLISKGLPEIQVPGHTRWVEYKEMNELIATINSLKDQLQCIVARNELCKKLPIAWNVQPFGIGQRPSLDWCPDGIDTIDFLCSL